MPATGEQQTTASRSSRPSQVVVLVLVVVVLGIVAARAWQGRDPFRPGTTHQAALVGGDCGYWRVQLDARHVWRNTQGLPPSWGSEVQGELEVIDDDDAVFTTGGEQVRLWGGDLDSNPPKAFTADCPGSLPR